MYTCGADCRIVSWSLSNSRQIDSWRIGNDKPTSLLYLQESRQFVVGSRELKQWSLQDGAQLIQTYTGHTSDVTILKYLQLNGHEYVLSTSRNDRAISMWRIKSGEKYKNAVATFLMSQVAYYVSCSVIQDRLDVVAATSLGDVDIFSMVAKLDK